MLLPLALFLTFVGLASVVLLGHQYVSDRKQVSRSLREANVAVADAWDVRARELADPLSVRVLQPALERLGDAVRRVAPSGVMKRLDDELTYAGAPAGWDGERLLVLKAVLAAGLALSTPLWAPALGIEGTRLVFTPPLAAFVGWFAPEWVLRSKSGERQGAIRRALPDALDLLAITVQAGLAFDGALDKVARQLGGPLGEEFTRVVQEMRIGASRGEALRSLRDRTNVVELQTFVLALVQADAFGISIANVLKVQSVEIRTKRRQRAEEQAQKLPVKLIMPLMSCIFPSLFVVLLGPAALDIYDKIIKGSG